MIIKPKNEKNIRHVLAFDPAGNNEPEITTPQQWQQKRETLHATLSDLLGQPSQTEIPAPRFEVLEERETADYRQLKIAYETEPGEEVRAYLLVPPREKQRQNSAGKSAAVLCLHGTSPDAKDSLLGAGQKPNRDLARFLSQNGFITLSPDHICSGERKVPGAKDYDTTSFYQRHPNWSAAGKAIWDGSRALDILETIPEVDTERLGCIGHSLGGHGTMWLAAFDERVRAGVYSCGLSTWQNNPQHYKWSRQEWYVYIPKLRAIFDEYNQSGKVLPVEMHEFAALVAPRAMLNISGMTDETYGNNETLPEVGLQLNALWEILGAPAGFAQFLFGAGHDVPRYSQMLILGWFEHWLGNLQN
jgi:pimeloyl-ACP methyl ester carboxylesterase